MHEPKRTELIRFDWAMKRLLRDKANFVVLEGFLSVLLRDTVKIQSILSSQSNQKNAEDKYNDVDVLIKNSRGEYIIIEVQNTKQNDYFHRILYGAARVITEYISSGDAYEEVKKVVSITIAYFDLGLGQDYVYYGTTNFVGVHQGDTLTLSATQRERYQKTHIKDIYPEFWLIKASVFDTDQVHDDLDQWIYFFKTGAVLDNFTAPGLTEAQKLLDKLQLPPNERLAYNEFEERLRKLASYQLTQMQEVQDLVKEAVTEALTEATAAITAQAAAEKAQLTQKIADEKVQAAAEKAQLTQKIADEKVQTILHLYLGGVPVELIAVSVGKSMDEIQHIIHQHKP